MRVDLQKIRREIESERAIKLAEKLYDLPTEHQVIAAWISETGAAEHCADLELDDFFDPRCRSVVAAIRNSHAANYVEVIEAIEKVDLEFDQHVADTVRVWLADLIGNLIEAPTYGGRWDVFRVHALHLRDLATKRRSVARMK